MIDGESPTVTDSEPHDDDVDELRLVLESLPCDEHGLPCLAGISDKQLRTLFEEAARRRDGAR